MFASGGNEIGFSGITKQVGQKQVGQKQVGQKQVGQKQAAVPYSLITQQQPTGMGDMYAPPKDQYGDSIRRLMPGAGMQPASGASWESRRRHSGDQAASDPRWGSRRQSDVQAASDPRWESYRQPSWP